MDEEGGGTDAFESVRARFLPESTIQQVIGHFSSWAMCCDVGNIIADVEPALFQHSVS